MIVTVHQLLEAADLLRGQAPASEVELTIDGYHESPRTGVLRGVLREGNGPSFSCPPLPGPPED